ncbi:MAG: tandem-95 repeat protein, partial [Acidimicrobiales bacterium]|nr:tandem-95 repeat protein [Acidimicrobiales bacterium]
MTPHHRPTPAARRAALDPRRTPATSRSRARHARRRPRLTKQTAIVAVIAQLLAVVGVIAVTSSPASALPAPVMTGYVPLPADAFQGALAGITTSPGTTLDFTVGITNAGAGAVMYYDQWEDGFEPDLSNPTQSSTLVFGDGNTSNGNAATYCARCTGDTLPQGAALIMRNNVTTPRSAGTTKFDGSDKVGSTRGFAITAGGFTTTLGSLLAAVVASYDTSKYDTAYTAPVGTDTPSPSGTSNAHSYAAFIVQAAQDGTVVQVDRDGDGTPDVTRTIAEGEATRVPSIREGGTVHSSKPVQVQLITGDTSASYESRSYTLFPDTTLSSDYMSPAGSGVDNFRTINYLYNPHATALTVTPTCTGCSGTITVPADASAAYASPTGKAVRFQSTDGRTFIAIGGVGAQSGAAPGGSGDSSLSWDWGFTMIPTSQLTTQVVLGWAPGNSNNPPSSPSANRDDDPVWVTTLGATTLRVDYDGDPSTGSISGSDCFGAKHDANISVAALASTRIYDATDGDMTGARIYTCDGTQIAGAWGQDPANAPVGSPGFDAGYTVIPTTTMLVNKTGALGNDLDGDGAFGPGDTITYEVAIADAGSLAFTGVELADELPDGLRYVEGSTTFDDGDGNVTPIADDVVPPAATPFPLDEAGTELPNIAAGDTVYVHFDAEIIAPTPLTEPVIGNTACVTAAEASACDSTTTELVTSDLSLTKAVTTAPAVVGDDATFTLTVSNAGPDAASNVEVTDDLPAGLDLVSTNPSQGTYDGGTGTWAVGTLAAGTSATLEIVATVTASDVRNVAEITSSGSWDPDSQPAEDVLGDLGPNQDDEAEALIEDLPIPVVAVDDDYTTPYLTPLTVDAPGVLDDDSGEAITVTSYTQPAQGTVALDPDGSFVYTPPTGFRGETTFTYTITGTGGSDTATVTITVAAPDEPVAADDAHRTPWGTPLTVDAPGILGNDTGTGITVNDHTDPGHGMLAQQDDGSFTYTPDAGFHGVDTYDYEIIDETGQTASATVRITVDPPTAPTAVDDAHSTGYETPLVIDAGSGVLGNDTGTDIEVTSYGQPSHGSVTMAPDGSFTYIPEGGFHGTDSFPYGITDAADQTASATVTVTVDPPAAPTATDDSATTPFETPVTIVTPGVLGNDTGTGITVTDHGTPGHGTVTVEPDGAFTYTPDAGFTGTDTFTYEITDEVGQTASATVTVTVDPPAAPTATDDDHTTPYETPLTVDAPGILGNDTGVRIGVSSNDPAAHGTIVVNLDGSFTYTPDDGFWGVDAVDYEIIDAAGQHASATITITVPRPGAPVATDDAHTTPYATPLTVIAPGILGNDTGTGITVTDHGDPAHGSVAVQPDGRFVYVPVSGFAGTDSFTYEITDETGQTATATVTITVDPPAVPEANDDAHATPYETPLVVDAPGALGNDVGEEIHVISHGTPLHGSITVAADGSFTYTPDDRFTGTDSVEYTIADAVGQTVSATITITVGKPDAPAAADDAYATPYETTLVVVDPGVLGNDAGTGITVTDVGTPGHGTASIDPDTGELTYTPDAGFTGTDTFTYEITD